MNLSKLNRILLQTLLLPVVALMLISLVLVWQIHNAEQTVQRIQIADQNIANANLITALIGDEETGVRGYQNTSNEIFLQPYEFAVGPLQDSIARLRTGIASQHGDQRPIDDLVATHQQWVNDIAEPMIDVVRNGGNSRDPGINLRGKAAIDNMREIIAGIVDNQKQISTLAVQGWQQQVTHTLYGVVITALLAGLLIGLFARSRLHMVSAAFQTTLEALRANTQVTYDSEQRLLATLTSIGDGVVVCDPDGKIELLNIAAQRLTGWVLDDALGQPVDEVLHLVGEESDAPFETPFHFVKRLYQATGVASHAMLVRADGTELHVDASGAPIQDHSGGLAGVVIVVRDVTEQRRTQSALMASEKLAVAGRLAATIAHEIHNPLDAVVNLLYLMKSSTPEETAEFVSLASAEIDRVTQISRAMLGMYRESRTPVALELKPILESVLVLLERQLAHAQITIHTEIPDHAVVTGYPAELRQVFANLISNAAEASSPGGTIEVAARVLTASGRSSGYPRAGVLVIINDHGQGILPDDLDHLFQPFFTTKGENGTGLGLWVSQGIVQKHGGSITVESRTDPEHHGTTMSVFLPRGEAQLPAA